MATDILPKTDGCDRIQKEAENFAINSNDKVVRRVEDEAAIEVLNDILTELGGSAGTPFRLFNRIASTPGVMQVLLATVVGGGETLTPKSIRVSSRKPGTYDVKIDGNTIGSGRIGPGNMNDDFIFTIGIVLNPTQTLSVEYTALTNNPASDVDVTLFGLK